MPLGSASSRNGGDWRGPGRPGRGRGGGGGARGRGGGGGGGVLGGWGGGGVGGSPPPRPFHPPPRRPAEPPSLGPSARRTRARPDNQQRQTGGIEIGGGDALHIIARDR